MDNKVTAIPCCLKCSDDSPFQSSGNPLINESTPSVTPPISSQTADTVKVIIFIYSSNIWLFILFRLMPAGSVFGE